MQELSLSCYQILTVSQPLLYRPCLYSLSPLEVATPCGMTEQRKRARITAYCNIGDKFKKLDILLNTHQSPRHLWLGSCAPWHNSFKSFKPCLGCELRLFRAIPCQHFKLLNLSVTAFLNTLCDAAVGDFDSNRVTPGGADGGEVH
jgi:hypothetical protein